MAHQIDMSNNRANMAYRGKTPWHNLGQRLTENADIDTWKREAGLNWVIHRAPVQYGVDVIGEERNTFLEKHVLFRSDNHNPLSVVSDSYKIVQPGEILEFYRDLVDTVGYQLETAGSLFDGKRIWALARTGDSLRIKGQDQVDGFLLLATSCDGSLATTAKFTTVRVVCNNTLAMSGVYSKANDGRVRVPHSTEFNADSVKKQLGIGQSAWAEFSDMVSVLSDRKVNQGEAQKWLVETFGDATKAVDAQGESEAKLMQKVWDSVRNSPGSTLQSANGTAWGLINGVTYFVDHLRNTRTDDARFDAGQFGIGADMKKKALENALKLVA